MKDGKYYIYRLDMTCINILMILLFIIFVFFTSLFMDIKLLFSSIINNSNCLILYFIYMLLHEAIHGISYCLNGAKFNKLTFGIMLEKGILYCLCKQNINKKNIMISSLAPLFLIGIVTYIIGILTNNYILVLLSILNIGGSAGDIVTFNFLLKLKNIEFSEMDDAIGFAIYSSKNISKIKSLGIKYITTKDSIKRKDLRKFSITVWSIVVIMSILIFSI